MTPKKDSPVIIDTSAIISILLEDDSNHTKALKILKKLTQKQAQIAILTDVYTETINIVGKKWGRLVALETANYIHTTSGFLLLTTPDVYDEALNKYKTYLKFPSFTDCLVMAAADKHNTKEVFGFDECFIKNGYILPK